MAVRFDDPAMVCKLRDVTVLCESFAFRFAIRTEVGGLITARIGFGVDRELGYATFVVLAGVYDHDIYYTMTHGNIVN